MHVLDKNKKASGKESSDQQRLQQRLPEGTRAPMEPLEGRNIQDGLGKGRESPGPGLSEKEKGWTSTPFCCGCIFLAYLLAALKSLLPGPCSL